MSAAGLAAPPAAGYSAPALMRDGTSILVRAIRPGDKPAPAPPLRGPGARLALFPLLRVQEGAVRRGARYFTEPDFVRHVGLVAVRIEHGREDILAVARYTPTVDAPTDPTKAEFAVAVADAWQGRGLGTLLLEHLARVALAAGVTEFEADVLGANTRMVAMLRATGFALQLNSRGGVFRYAFPTSESDDHIQASERRAWSAAAESLRGVLAPRSVAVVGASRRPGTIGWALVENLKRHGFTGPVYPVHPSERRDPGPRRRIPACWTCRVRWTWS